MTIARACRPPTRDYAGGWQAAGGLLSTLLADRPHAGGQGAHPHPLILAMVRVGMIGGSAQ